MIKKKNILFILFLFSFFSNSYGGEPIAVYGDWSIFRVTDNHKRLLCYMMSMPQQRYDNFNKRGQSFFSVILEKESDKIPELFLSYGQILDKKITRAELDIVKRKFPIFTYKDKGWAYNLDDDKSIIAELKKSAVFSVIVEYENDKQLIDIYSLNGFNEAYAELLKMCE